MYHLNVITREGRLVSNLLAQAVPRVGELVCIHRDVTDEASWEPVAGGPRMFDRYDWRVINVLHEFRNTGDVRQQAHSITLVVEESSAGS